jgi:hypothetical protein
LQTPAFDPRSILEGLPGARKSTMTQESAPVADLD